MMLKTLMKNPVLMVGILLMFIFLSSLREKGIFSSRTEKLTPTSCKATLVMLEKRIPGSWTTKCFKNNMQILINSTVDISKLKNGEKDLKAALYRDFANDLVFIAKNSPVDTLERTDAITIRVEHDLLRINAATMGKDLIKLSTMKSNRFIKDHLKATVKIQEVKK
ncbi:hypothetical protein HBN50_12175 [Halobacteriovorax sp. GB3]|uniref:hypothetical protein n=1 Tax=Halobacteriovorax sp. GB3 TaxID=2719615 RepID=UPI002362A4EB|nr:hypothetical protein [Halobacteriovorax sp. GB3]MDD0853859.1 hypothetical protein [Halobacteriovorax sp. GB3]